MPIETELKLRISPEHLNQLKRHPLFKQLTTALGTRRKLYNVYYDTPDFQLHRHAMALRLRRIGKQWWQTLKGGGEVNAGLHLRNEWETPVTGEAFDFNALQASGSPRLSSALRKKLKPLFVTDFTRTTYPLIFKGAEIELCMDDGEIRSGQYSHVISELELELKSGEPAQLFNLALVLLDIIPLEVEPINKAEYGYGLFSHTEQTAVKAFRVDISKCPDIPGALRTLIWSCLLHLQANLPGGTQKIDDERLHQIRVALRRLRVMLSMAESFHTDTGLSALRGEVAQRCVELGRLREWDVLLTSILPPLLPQLSKQAGSSLLRIGQNLRGRHQASTVTTFHSKEYQSLMLRLGAGMYGNYWLGQAGNKLSLEEFARKILGLHCQRVTKFGKHLANANPEQLHKLRIACKKLRYSAEAFVSLFNSNKTTAYLSNLASLQDCLGTLHDFTVSLHQLDEIDAQSQQKNSVLLSTLQIRGWIKHQYQDQLIILNEAWKKFSRQKAF